MVTFVTSPAQHSQRVKTQSPQTHAQTPRAPRTHGQRPAPGQTDSLTKIQNKNPPDIDKRMI